MALTNTNIPNAASDVVGVFDQDFNQVFPLARPVKCMVDENAKAMEHPVETGSVITDHIIFQPNEIELSTILPSNEYRSVYQQISQIYRSGTVLTVQTKATTYKNMYIFRMPHQEDVDFFDTIPLILRMRQILIIETAPQALSPATVQNPVNQSTINNGIKQPGQTMALPGPEVFADDAGLVFDELPPNPLFFDPLLAPNQKSYEEYGPEVIDLPVVDLNQEQIEQILEAR